MVVVVVHPHRRVARGATATQTGHGEVDAVRTAHAMQRPRRCSSRGSGLGLGGDTQHPRATKGARRGGDRGRGREAMQRRGMIAAAAVLVVMFLVPGQQLLVPLLIPGREQQRNQRDQGDGEGWMS